MEANEVRIGNWFRNPVTKIESQCTAMDISDLELKIKQREGIPLTEWLLKFGFAENWECFTINDTISFSKNLETTYVVFDSEVKPSLKYVHQLQNLYFALTAQELYIKN